MKCLLFYHRVTPVDRTDVGEVTPSHPPLYLSRTTERPWTRPGMWESGKRDRTSCGRTSWSSFCHCRTVEVFGNFSSGSTCTSGDSGSGSTRRTPSGTNSWVDTYTSPSRTSLTGVPRGFRDGGDGDRDLEVPGRNPGVCDPKGALRWGLSDTGVRFPKGWVSGSKSRLYPEHCPD